MRPPFCRFCQKLGGPGEATLVGFADYRPLDEGIVGHPHGLEWFCSEHVTEARSFSHLPVDAAVERMRAGRRNWWQRLRNVWIRALKRGAKSGR